MATRTACLAAFLLLMAGCATPQADEPVAAVTGIDFTQDLLRLPDGRAVAASMRLHEEVDASVADLDWVDGDEPWAPRDLDVTFHGIQEVYDEFGRPTPAFVFRVPEMVFVQDDISFGADGINIDGHYEVHDYEYAFEASDGRLLGTTDVTLGMRGFPHPDFRHPYGSLAVLFMASKMLADDLTQEVLVYRFDGHDLLYRFQPYDGERPMEGDCAMWELTSRFEPPLEAPAPAAPATPDAIEDEPRTLACLPTGDLVPLWTWAGTEGNAYRLTRLTPAFPLPDYDGEVLPPVAYTSAPWQETRPLLPLPVPEPMLVPPTEPGGTWAREVADRAAALHLSPGYIAYRQDAPMPYLDLAWVGMPDLSLGVLNVTVPLPLVSGPLFDSMSWILLADGKKNYNTFVHTREGTAEQPDVHVADPQGFTWDDVFGSPGADALPPLVPDAPMEGQLADLAPEEVNEIIFLYAQFDTTTFVYWQVTQKCTAEEEGYTLAVDGLRGHAQLLGRIPAGNDDRCMQESAAFAHDHLPSSPGHLSHWMPQAPQPQGFPSARLMATR